MLDGRVRGRPTAGVIHYTIGQRRGLGDRRAQMSRFMWSSSIVDAHRQVDCRPERGYWPRGTVPVREINWLGDGTFYGQPMPRDRRFWPRSGPPALLRDAVLRPHFADGTAQWWNSLGAGRRRFAGSGLRVLCSPRATRVLGGGWIWRGH